MARLTPKALHELGTRALTARATAPEIAACVMDALVAAEAAGQKGHGAARIPSYAAQAKSGKVDGRATPHATALSDVALRVDARGGFAYPAIDLALNEAATRAKAHGVAIAAIAHSHHCGQAGWHVERLAERGLIGLFFANSPSAIAPWGGSRPIFGTNPIAFAAPRGKPGEAPLVIDLSLSKVARGKVMLAKQKGEAIPEGWAVDADGEPTTDPGAALAGSMLPMGDAKGAALVLMVELLAASLSGSHAGFEASSFFDADGPPPGVGQLLIAIEPMGPSGGAWAERVETLIAAMTGQDGARLPGTRRLAARAAAERDGLDLPDTLIEEIEALARG